jgi:MFS family permease
VALLYFAEGLPFGMVLDNFPVYFRVHGVSLAAIGALSLLRTPWWAKVFWSPLVDQIGERRQWVRGALVAMAAALLAVSVLPAGPGRPPAHHRPLRVHDRRRDAGRRDRRYTIELLAPGEEGVANGVRVSAYRAALIFAGGVLVALAAWRAGRSRSRSRRRGCSSWRSTRGARRRRRTGRSRRGSGRARCAPGSRAPAPSRSSSSCFSTSSTRTRSGRW